MTPRPIRIGSVDHMTYDASVLHDTRTLCGKPVYGTPVAPRALTACEVCDRLTRDLSQQRAKKEQP